MGGLGKRSTGAEEPSLHQLNKFCVVPRHFLLVTKGELDG